jgi:hypothetical protein
MSSNNDYLNNIMDDSYHAYIKPIYTKNSTFYRIFDYNNNNEHIVINGKIDKIVNYPKNLNILLNIDSSYGNIIHIPMMSDMYIDYMTDKYLINIKDLSMNNNTYKTDNDKIKFLSVKKNTCIGHMPSSIKSMLGKIIYQDILIHVDNNIIIVQIYKCSEPINDITHGAFIIYQNSINMNNQNNSIFYTKNNSNLIINDIKDISSLNNINKINYN